MQSICHSRCGGGFILLYKINRHIYCINIHEYDEWMDIMKPTRLIISSLIFLLFLSACGIAPSQKPVTDDAMQTEIVMLLTSMVTPTPLPPVINTPVPLEPTPTLNPAMIPGVLVTATPTPEIETETEEPLPDLDITPSEAELELITFTPSDSEGEEITETPVPEETQDRGEPDYADTFENGDAWYLGKDQWVDLKVSSGNLVMIGLTPTSGWRLTKQTLRNGYIELTGKMAECAGTDSFGLMYRVPNMVTATSGYLFGITCDGKVSLRKWDGEKMYSLIAWKSSDAIKTGSNQTNKLGIELAGSQMSIYVNDTLIGTARDGDYTQGGVGVYISAKETDNLTALMDDLSIWIE